MLTLEVQGYEKPFVIENIVFDYNGTLACDGRMSQETKEGIKKLYKSGFKISILTADIFGTVKEECKGLPVDVKIFDKGNAEDSKREIIENLGAQKTVAIGNGRNDLAMLKEASIGIGIIGMEGSFAGILQVADIVVTSIHSAIGLLLNPGRISGTLRK